MGEEGHTMMGATPDNAYNNVVHELQTAQKTIFHIEKFELAVIVLNG